MFKKSISVYISELKNNKLNLNLRNFYYRFENVCINSWLKKYNGYIFWKQIRSRIEVRIGFLVSFLKFSGSGLIIDNTCNSTKHYSN